jgi:hypothetical protein
MPADSAGQRRYERSPYKEKLEIRVHSRSKEETLLGISSNISDFGVCIYTFKPLKEGQDIIFKSNLPVQHHRAIVRWVKQCNRSIYQVGVLFTD